MIQGVTRKVLDPRRPLRSAATSEDREEGIFPYHPYAAIQPKDVISHNCIVYGVSSIQSLPTDLESTSIVLASGIDLFLTRRMPSNAFDTLADDFSYFQLEMSVLLLTFGVYITGRQLVAKNIKDAWE